MLENCRSQIIIPKQLPLTCLRQHKWMFTKAKFNFKNIKTLTELLRMYFERVVKHILFFRKTIDIYNQKKCTVIPLEIYFTILRFCINTSFI